MAEQLAAFQPSFVGRGFFQVDVLGLGVCFVLFFYSPLLFFFFFNFIYLFIFGCVGSLLLRVSFL